MKILVTGSAGLIGSEAVMWYDRIGWNVLGVDGNLRAEFFGPQGDTRWNTTWLLEHTTQYQHLDADIRDRSGMMKLIEDFDPDLVFHCAAQPSHDRASRIPFVDFDINAVGTLNLLEATRRHSPQAVFIHMSTNKVYGDAPNDLPMVETDTRYDYARLEDRNGISETCRLDRSTHSLFGASKLAADIMAQEYGRYFGLKVGIFRGGCLTGGHHSGVELHGFLSHLVKVALRGGNYRIIGYKGKQVRDNLHSFDVVSACHQFFLNPQPGEVYNLGGGRENSISILEAIARVSDLTNRQMEYTVDDTPRKGDHICYISDLSKLREHFPEWSITRNLEQILEELVSFGNASSAPVT